MAATDTGERTVLHGFDQQGTTAQRPADPVLGHLFYDVTVDSLLYWDGAAWRVVSEGVQSVTPDDAEGTGNTILPGVTAVDVGAVTNDANDFIVLPDLADVPVGHEFRIACNAGTNFELRTPASSGEKINNVDSDGTQEYLCTDTDTVRIWKVSATDGWAAQSLTILGAVRTAVVPD